MPIKFYEKLKSHKFIITTEISPPKGIETTSLLNYASELRENVDAFNVTDSQRAIMRMSPISFGKLLTDIKCEPILQLTCRDRNRIGLQSDLLGAWALGIENVCVMTGDYPTKGDHPSTKPVYDLDSVQLIETVNKLNNGYDMAGNKLDGAPNFTVGAVSNIDLNHIKYIKLKKKTQMGLNFIQTQAIYDIEIFEDFIEKTNDLEVPVIAGIIPLKSAKMALYMNQNIPGIKVPQELISRIEKSINPVQEGINICIDTIKEVKKMCRGVHLMPINQQMHTKYIIEKAGLTKRD